MASQSKSNKANSAKPVSPAKAEPVAKPAAKPVKAPARREPTQEEIQTRAFEIYVSEGCQDGNDLQYWLRAEKDLRSSGR